MSQTPGLVPVDAVAVALAESAKRPQVPAEEAAWLLVSAAAWLQRPGVWCRGEFALDERGEPADPLGPEARRYDAGGALVFLGQHTVPARDLAWAVLTRLAYQRTGAPMAVANDDPRMDASRVAALMQAAAVALREVARQRQARRAA